MNAFYKFTAMSFAALSISSLDAYAVVDANAPVVTLRTTCQEGPATLNNCFTSTAAVTDWINTTRLPSDSAPLLVEVGPGSFGTFICSKAGISLRGAGSTRTKLGNDSIYGISARTGCDNFNVESLSAESIAYGVDWEGGVNSTWTNVVAKGGQYGWKGPDAGCATGAHRWRSSLIVATGASAIGYYDNCGEHWFLGTEVAADAGASKTLEVIGVYATGGEFHFYGSNIRATGSTTVMNSGGPIRVTAVSVTGGSEVHIHGTGIDAIGKGPYDVAGIWADSGSHIHATASGYNLQAVAGQTRHRLKDDGALHLHAPYLWEQHAEPPAALTSVSGADMAVVTNTVDGQPHLLVYSSNCTSKWFDTTDKICRP